jgi:hypothetical protein
LPISRNGIDLRWRIVSEPSVRQRLVRLVLDVVLDATDDPLGFPFLSVNEKPPGTLGDVAPHHEHHQPESRTDAERDPPIPPSSELSSPTTAFCTTLDTKEDDNEVERIHCGQPAFAGSRNNTITGHARQLCGSPSPPTESVRRTSCATCEPLRLPLKEPNCAAGQANQTTPGKSISGVSR